MALPATGSISMSQVNVELGKAATAIATFNDTAVRALAGAPTGPISMAMLRGKSSVIRFINTVNRTQASIHTLMGSPTSAGEYIFENAATISAATQGGWALQTGSFPAGSTLTIINHGHIRGGGGNGGAATAGGAAGGTALILNFPTSIDNTSGTIWGGGGGGGGGAYGGGGGGGIPAGAGGAKGVGFGVGYAGSEVSGGAGGGSSASISGGRGGDVGNAGARGNSAGGAWGAGGRGGYAVQGNGNAATWIAAGDRRGDVV